MPKRPIDILRESSASMDVGTPEEGPIEGFMNLGDRLLIIKKKAVYDFILADTIDPERTNIAIPNTQQRVLGIGSESQILCRVLMTADILFTPNRLQHVIDCEAAKNAAYCATLELAAMEADREQLGGEINEALANAEGELLTPGFKIPVIANLEARTKAILYRGHDVIKSLMDIARLFYGQKITHPDSLLKHVEASCGPEDSFRKFVEDVVPVLRFIWNTRNAIAHPKPHMRILVSDFSLQSDGMLVVPSIEMIHPDTPQPTVTAIELFDSIIESLQTIFEEFSALLCGQHAKFGEFQISVMEVPPELRRQEHVRFSYVVKLDGQWQPLG